MDAILPILRDFGFPIALCVVLIIAIREMMLRLMKAHAETVRVQAERIDTLEEIVTTLHTKVDTLQTQQLSRAEEYGNSLKDVASRYATAIRDTNAWGREMTTALRRLADAVAELVKMTRKEYAPTPRPPSSDEIPTPPAKDASTDRIFRHG